MMMAKMMKCEFFNSSLIDNSGIDLCVFSTAESSSLSIDSVEDICSRRTNYIILTIDEEKWKT